MFDLGATELLVIGIVAIIVVGPKDLPKMLRGFGQFVAKMRGMAREFQSMFEEAARDTGIDDVAKSVSDVKDFSVTDSVSSAFDPITEEAENLKRDMETEIPVPEGTTASKPKEDPVDAGNKAAAAASKKKPAARRKKRAPKRKSKATG